MAINPATTAFKAVAIGVEATDKLMRTLLEMTKAKGDAEIAEFLKECLDRGETMKYVNGQSFLISDLEKELSERGIFYSPMLHPDSKEAILVYRQVDEEKVLDSIESVKAMNQRVTRVSDKTFAELYADKNICRSENLSLTQMNVFGEEAKRLGLVFNAQRLDSEHYCVRYGMNDQEKAEKALEQTMLRCAGERGKLEKQQTEYEIKTVRTSALESIKDPQKELVIVSSTNPDNYIAVSSTGFKSYDRNGILRNDATRGKDFSDALMREMSSLHRPVILSAKDFASSEKASFIEREAKAYKPQGIDFEKFNIEKKCADYINNGHTAQELLDNLRKYEEKLSYDNVDDKGVAYEPNDISDITNNEISMDKFKDIEASNEQAAKEENKVDLRITAAQIETARNYVNAVVQDSERVITVTASLDKKGHEVITGIVAPEYEHEVVTGIVAPEYERDAYNDYNPGLFEDNSNLGFEQFDDFGGRDD